MKNINQTIQAAINPPIKGVIEMKDGDRVFRKNDKVLHTKNTEDICNGDIGLIMDVTMNNANEKVLYVAYSGLRSAEYERDDLDLLELAFALTVHKSQGSEYPIVIIPVLYSFYVMLKRDIYYTAVTRAKQKVVLVGQLEAFIQAIRTAPKERNTRLAQRVINFYCELRAA